MKTVFGLPAPNYNESNQPGPLFVLAVALQEGLRNAELLAAHLPEIQVRPCGHHELVVAALDRARDSAADIDFDLSGATRQLDELFSHPVWSREAYMAAHDLVVALNRCRRDLARRIDQAFGTAHVASLKPARRVPLWVSLRVTQFMVRLLPRADRALYRELYRSELSELAQGKHALWAQIGYTLRALGRVWSLRKALVVEAVGEVDQA